MVTHYNIKMPGQSDPVEVTPIAYWPNHKKLTVNGDEVKSGTTHAVELTPSENKIAITVTGNDGSTEAYPVQVQRRKQTRLRALAAASGLRLHFKCPWPVDNLRLW